MTLIRIPIKRYFSAYFNKPINLTLDLLEFIVKMIYQKVPIFSLQGVIAPLIILHFYRNIQGVDTKAVCRNFSGQQEAITCSLQLQILHK